MLGKARGSKQGNNLLVQEIEKAGGVDFTKPVLLGYTGLSDVLLLKYIEDSKHIWEAGLETVRYTTIGSVIGFCGFLSLFIVYRYFISYGGDKNYVAPEVARRKN